MNVIKPVKRLVARNVLEPFETYYFAKNTHRNDSMQTTLTTRFKNDTKINMLKIEIF